MKEYQNMDRMGGLNETAGQIKPDRGNHTTRPNPLMFAVNFKVIS